ncbi:MAG: DUF58 domain-containing protein [Planctomycetes bacterium]|nr:DUF58 domain-containing protein [Planctomycetota bacterium]
MRIRSLELRAKVVVEGFYAGLHRSPYHGFSVEFSEYRQYSPGDDPRYLDWRLYARSDRYYVKRFEDETNLRCHLVVDGSRSMGYGSSAWTKAEYARTLAATLAYFLATQRDAVGVATFDARITDAVPPRFRPGHLHRLMRCLERPLTGRSTDLAAPLEEIAKAVAKRGMIVIISDLLAPVDALETRLGYLRARGHEVLLFRVLDPVETDLALPDPGILIDLESGREFYVDPAAARDAYRRRFEEHAAAVARAAIRLSIDFVTLTTDRPLEFALFDFLNARLRRGRRVLRRGRGTRRGR